MNAIDFLIQEHNKVRKILTDISDNKHRYETKKILFAELCDDLIRHEKMEHQIWYPLFKNDDRLNDKVRHLISEEKSAERAIAKFDEVTNEAMWEEKFIKFKSDVENHATEEENDLFPEVKKLLSEADLKKIGKKMKEFKNEYVA